MTIADRLLEIGLRCPCGGEVRVYHELDAGEVYYAACREPCESCTGIYNNAIDALAAWLVLTGGPIPLKMRPKRIMGQWIDMDFWLRPEYRTEAHIKPWLQEEYHDPR